MASKELFDLVAEAIIDNPPVETMTDAEIIIDWSPTTNAVLSTILAALQEPTGAMLEMCEREDAIKSSYVTYSDYWRAMLNASPLGEQSDG